MITQASIVNDGSILSSCFNRIFALFEMDLYNYVDAVIYDSEEDPQFSAKTLLDRLEDAVIIHNALYKKLFSGIEGYLQYLGYPTNTRCLLESKKEKEDLYN